MSVASPRRGLTWPVRLLLVVVAVAACAAPVYLLLEDAQIESVLGWIFPPGLNLSDPDLIATWRALLATATGLIVCLLLATVALTVRRRRRRARARRQAAEPLTELRRAIDAGDPVRLEAAARRIAEEQGDEVVPDLIAELGRATDDSTRQELAATLYKLGRAVTAEVRSGSRA